MSLTPTEIREKFEKYADEVREKGDFMTIDKIADWWLALFQEDHRGLIEEMDKDWSFDENQQHTHTWHDKQDFISSHLNK